MPQDLQFKNAIGKWRSDLVKSVQTAWNKIQELEMHFFEGNKSYFRSKADKAAVLPPPDVIWISSDKDEPRSSLTRTLIFHSKKRVPLPDSKSTTLSKGKGRANDPWKDILTLQNDGVMQDHEEQEYDAQEEHEC